MYYGILWLTLRIALWMNARHCANGAVIHYSHLEILFSVVKSLYVVSVGVDGHFSKPGMGAYSSTDTRSALYIGGHERPLHKLRGVRSRRGFTGCIRKIVIGETPLKIPLTAAGRNTHVGVCPVDWSTIQTEMKRDQKSFNYVSNRFLIKFFYVFKWHIFHRIVSVFLMFYVTNTFVVLKVINK